MSACTEHKGKREAQEMAQGRSSQKIGEAMTSAAKSKLSFEELQKFFSALKLLIENPSGISFEQLKKDFKLNRSQAEEWLNIWQVEGFPLIKYFKNRDLFVGFIPGFESTPPLKLSLEEIYYRAFVNYAFDPLQEIPDFNLSSVQRKKLFELLPENCLDLLDVQYHPEMFWQQVKIDFSLLLPRIHLINEAILSRSLVLFEVNDGFDKNIKHPKSFYPIEFFCHAGSYFAIAFDLESQKFVCLLLEEITKMGTVEKNSQPKLDFNFQTWWNQLDKVVLDKRKEKITLFYDDFFTQYLEKSRGKKCFQDLPYTHFKEGGSSIEFNIRVSQEVVHWVKLFAQHSEVLAPEKYQVCSKVSPVFDDKKKFAA